MFEQLVRPYQSPGAVVSRGVVSKHTKKARGRSRIVWGDVGTLPVAEREDIPTDPSGYSFKLETCDDTYKEHKRETDSVRVENPNDSSQYVIVDRVKLISFAHQTDSKVLSSFSTETTAFADTSIPDDSVWGTVKASDRCKATYKLSNDGSSAP